MRLWCFGEMKYRDGQSRGLAQSAAPLKGLRFRYVRRRLDTVRDAPVARVR